MYTYNYRPAKSHNAAYFQTLASFLSLDDREKTFSPNDSSKHVDNDLRGRSTSQTILCSFFQASSVVFGDQKWEIMGIVNRRQMGNGYEYKVC